jgi:hypothetical protein
MNFKSNGLQWVMLAALLALPLWAYSSAQSAKDALNLEVRLIWGANEPESPDKKHTPLDSSLTKYLKERMKWKYYFEVNRQTPAIPLNAKQRLKMSDKCELDIKYVGNSKVEVEVIGGGKSVRKVSETLTDAKDGKEGSRLIIGGDANNDTAWFIVIKKIPAGSPEKK